ncbi:glycosyltransferase family 2 protein [Collinsella sp. LCP21S3_E4]|uniref:glycosyltransferase family 2 protein n=1 Tax=Collinsella sp. LCP21S3_E4 TaxID=3438774 RepID=UPI003F936AA5
MPIVSVIIPSYNATDYIAQTLESVLAQTLTDIEVIVVDDGSTDNTRNIVADFANKDPRLMLVEQANQFAGVARNNGMSKAQGKYLYFLDADDYIETTTLEELVNAIEQHGADIAIAKSEGFDNTTGDTWTIDGALNGVDFDRPIAHAEYCDRLFQSFIGWPWDKLFRKEFIDKTALTFQPLRTTNDALFVFCALALAETIVCLDSVLFHHRTNNKNSLEGSRAKSWNNALCAIRAIGDRLSESTRGRACLNSYYRWILNYSLWTIESLPSAEADAYLTEIEPVIRAIPQNVELNLDPYENKLRELLDANRAKTISCAIALLRERDSVINEQMNLAHILEGERSQFESWRNESEKRLADIYGSHSYKLGNALLKPLSKVKDITGR